MRYIKVWLAYRPHNIHHLYCVRQSLACMHSRGGRNFLPLSSLPLFISLSCATKISSIALSLPSLLSPLSCTPLPPPPPRVDGSLPSCQEKVEKREKRTKNEISFLFFKFGLLFDQSGFDWSGLIETISRERKYINNHKFSKLKSRYRMILNKLGAKILWAWFSFQPLKIYQGWL